MRAARRSFPFPGLPVVLLLAALGPGRGAAASLPELPLSVETQGEAVWPILLSADGKILVGAGYDSQEKDLVVVWDASTGRRRGRWFIHRHETWCRALSPDGSLMACPGPESAVLLREVPTGRERALLKGHGREIAGVAFAPDGKMLASASRDGTVRLWELATRTQRAVVPVTEGYARHLAFSQEPAHIHVKAGEDEAKFWLDPVQLAANYGFNGSELTHIQRVIDEHRDELWEAWHEHFGA